MVTRVIDVTLSFVGNGKEKSEKRHTWLTIPSKSVYQTSEINILVYCTNFAQNEIIRKHKGIFKMWKDGIFTYFEAVF